MRAHKRFSQAITLACFALVTTLAQAQTWTTLVNPPPGAIGLCMLLTDGGVMCQDAQTLSAWYKLTPDSSGSYMYGTWSFLVSLPSGYAPLDFASAVLADGRVVIVGGEYNGFDSNGNNIFALTDMGAIYDPEANTWTMLTPPPSTGSPNHFQCIGDAPATVLADGRLIIGSKLYQDLAVLDPATLSWSIVSATGKIDGFNAEEGWTLLPDGSFFTLDVKNAPSSESFFLTGPATGVWASSGSTPQDLHTPTTLNPITAPGCPTYNPPGEIGPTLLRPDGTVFAIGADGFTGIYTPPGHSIPRFTGTWARGPQLPPGLNVEDGPGAVLPSGHVLFGASPGENGPGLQYFEFDGTSLISIPAPAQASIDAAFFTSLLLLPSGQVMFSDQSTRVQLYDPAGPFTLTAWAPTISSVPSTINNAATYQINGTQFNGLNQGSAYGDEMQNATNYPLVRITNSTTGHVFYARTHNHSTMGVATGTTPVFTSFDVPANIEGGTSTIEVVANGISSLPVTVTVFTPNTVTPAAMTSPPNNSTLPGSSVTFQWNTGSLIQAYFLYVGTSAGSNDLYAQNQGTNTSTTVTGLPTDGRTIYVRLWSRNATPWFYNDYIYTTATSSPAPSIIEYQIPNPIPAGFSVPSGITAGPDGALWFTQFGGNQIGRVTTAGVFSEYSIPTPVSQPDGITTGPDAALWFTEYGGNKIGRITTAGVFNESSIPTANSQPDGITTGPDGAVWFTEYGGNKIGRITTAGVFNESSIPTPFSQPKGITTGPDGAVWFTEYGGNKIGRITTTGIFSEASIPTPASQPYGITVGPDGALWFTEYGGNKIGRITTTGAFNEYALPTPGSQPEGITTGRDGAVWFTEYGADSLGRITTAGVFNEYSISTPGGDPVGITSGPDGALWFTEPGTRRPRPGTIMGINQIGRALPVLLGRVGGDFDGNGVPDLVWQNDQTRQVTVWYMGGAGGAVFQGYNYLSASGVPGWHVVAVADFNGDGVPDLVWLNDQTRQATVWYMGGAGGAVLQGYNYLSAAGVPGWSIVAAADFNGDGVPDLVWQNDQTRQVTVWYMGGAGGAVFQGWNYLSAAGVSGWHVAAAADFNGDGVPDLVWQNDQTRQVTVWYMGGTGGAVFQGYNYLSATGVSGWHVVAAVDQNGDGVPDLVWENDNTRQVTVWYMGGAGGAVFQGWNSLSTAGVPGWSALN